MTNNSTVALILLMLLMAPCLGVSTTGQQAETTPGEPPGQPPIVEDVRIEIISSRADTSELAALARQMVFIRAGEPFSEESVQKTLTTLEDSRMFSSINIPDPDWNDERISLTIQLEPFRRIRKIDLSGIFPLLEREVENAMGLHPGQAVDEQRLPEIQESVVSLFREHGYIDPQADITFSVIDQTGSVDIRVDVDKGPYYKIDHLAIEGNESFSDFRLKLRTEAWIKSLFFSDLKRFSEDAVKDDTKNLLDFYRSKGYPDALITPVIEKDPEEASVRIILQVQEGPKYDIDFTGNQEYSAWWTLRDDLSFEYGNENDYGLSRSIRRIRDRYRSDGYLESQIDLEESRDRLEGKTVRKIEVVINEGTRSIIRNIRIDGNKAFDDGEIKGQMLTGAEGIFSSGGFDPSRLREDLEAIEFLYSRDGYRNAKITQSIEWSSEDNGQSAEAGDSGGKRYGDLILTIEEGVQTKVGAIELQGLTAIPPAEILERLELKEGGPFREYLMTRGENTINAMVSEQGYPWAEVTSSFELTEDESEAQVLYQVAEGAYTELAEVHFSGNFRTREETLRNRLEVKKGEPFSMEKILKTERNIREMNAVKSAQFVIPGLEENPENPVFLVEIEEAKPYWMGFSVGHDTERRLFVSGEGGDRNLLGRNKDLRGNFEISQVGYHGDVAVTDPWFLGSRISSTTTLYAERREALNLRFGTRGLGISQVFNRRFLDNRLSLGAGFSMEKRQQFAFEGAVIPPWEEYLYDSRTFFVATPSIVYNSTDSFVRPRRGFISSLFVDLSRGRNASLDNFLRYRLESRYYYTPVERVTFAFRGRYGFIDPYGSNRFVPGDQLFYLGGTSTVRGFEENLLRFGADGKASGGMESLLANAEARLDLGMNMELTTFYDAGAIRRPERPGATDRFRSSVGLGLRYITPIGAVGLLYGWKIDPLEGEKSSNLHFSIGYTF